MQDAEDDLGYERDGSVGHLARPRRAAFAVHQGDDVCQPFADDGVTLPIVDPAALRNDDRTRSDPLPAKPLAFPQCPSAVPPPLLAAAHVLPQRPPLAVGRDVLVEALVADGGFAGATNLTGLQSWRNDASASMRARALAAWRRRDAWRCAVRLA